MKTRIYQALAAVALAGCLAAPTAYAQLLTPRAADIPYDIIVHDVTMPAGLYTVNEVSGSSPALRIRSDNGRHAAFVLSTRLRATKSLDVGKWVFRRYGGQHFLAAVWEAGDGGGRELKTCRTETQLAKNLSEPGTVTLVAKKR